MAILTNKQALDRWEDFRANIVRSTPVPEMTEAEKKKFKERIEKHPEEWFSFMFPNYYTHEPADFQKKATRRIIKHERWFEVRRWARELAKSVRGMMEDLYMAMTGHASVFLLVSHSYDNAEELLMPYLINLESNQRLLWMYGTQRGIRQWETGKFVTRHGCSFRALGAKQSPRGTRNEEKRPDTLRIDDIDTDEMCRNPKRVQDVWEWVEQALLPTVSVSGKVRVVFQGNLISKNSIVARASENADYVETVNIRDKQGKSSWPEKNTEAQIDWLLGKMSYLSAQKEYYNNPIVRGTIFKQMTWGKVPPLSHFKFLVLYGDPAPSNKDNRNNCHKAVILMGRHKTKYYIINARVEHVANEKFVDWYHELNAYVKQEIYGDKEFLLYPYMENNSLQDPFYEQVFVPLMHKVSKKRGHMIYIRPDERGKPDKFARIDGNLSPINERGELIMNEKEKSNPHMKLLEQQFLAVEPTLSSSPDGPDAVEGGKWIIDTKAGEAAEPTFGMRGQGTYKNKKRF